MKIDLKRPSFTLTTFDDREAKQTYYDGCDSLEILFTTLAWGCYGHSNGSARSAPRAAAAAGSGGTAGLNATRTPTV
jgi:hypothetical protein